MSDPSSDTAEKTLDPTPEKLRKAREKGDIPRSADLSVAASYLGLVVALGVTGGAIIEKMGSGFMNLLANPEPFGLSVSQNAAAAPLAAQILWVARSALPVFALPALAVVTAIMVQRGFVFTLSKIAPKASRVSPISNAKNKFGRAGLFEFAKSTVKLVLYCVVLAVFLVLKADTLIGVVQTSPGMAAAELGRLFLEFMMIVCAIAGVLGAVDALWQHAEFLRKNRMSRKEVMDEAKESEGDPHLKMARRQKGQSIAMNQMLADVPKADVVVVNPTHYAVALKWSRKPGAAPECVAKGVDEVALTIRRKAMEAGVPIHSDPPSARALHAMVEMGEEVPEDLYQAVAVAIRFADDMRRKAKSRI